MDWSEFTKLEYVSLREEIKETKARLFKLAGAALVALPAAQSFASTYKLLALTLFLPLLIIAVVFLFMAESRALMRVGTYIMREIEPRITTSRVDGTCGGWENWLSRRRANEPSRRTVDKLVACCFYLLFFFYYAAAVYLAATLAADLFGYVGLGVAYGAYIGLGLLLAGLLAMNFQHSVETVPHATEP